MKIVKLPVFLWQANPKFIFWEILFMIGGRILAFFCFLLSFSFMFLFLLENICPWDSYESSTVSPQEPVTPTIAGVHIKIIDFKCWLFTRLNYFHITIPTLNIIWTNTAKIIANQDEWILPLIQDLSVIWTPTVRWPE